MAFLTYDGKLILDTNASDETIRVVLTQIQTVIGRVITYGSQTLGTSEWHYCKTDKELLAVKYFMKHYKHYLLG